MADLSQRSRLAFLLVLGFTYHPVVVTSCGEFIGASSASSTGTITSPGYPGNYGNRDKCVWLIEAPGDYNVQLSVTGVAGEQNASGNCVDYLEVRNGSSTQIVLLNPTCSSTTTQTVTSLSRWLWVLFKSDDENVSTGFTATWSIVAASTSNSNHRSPIPSCLGTSLQFLCDNKECISYSYKCDGYNDCGCSSGGCDEANCTDSFSSGAIVALGIVLGVTIFALVFFGIGALDIFLKKKKEKEYRNKILENQRRLKREKFEKRERQDSTGTGSRRESAISGTVPGIPEHLYSPRPKPPAKKPRPPSAVSRMSRTFRAGSKPI